MGAARIAVVGSSNTDLTVVADHLPRPGETVLGGDYTRAGGGKGANQAVAAARAGGHVTFVACVGHDDFGDSARQRLRAEGIDIQQVRRDENAPSGLALIIVEEGGENLIAVSPGANARLSPGDVSGARKAIAAADLLLLQLEIPMETVTAAVRTADEAGVPVLLDPAPAQALPEAVVGRLDYLTPNAGEAAALLGLAEPGEPEQMACALAEQGGPAVVLTLGAEGACVCDRHGPRRIKAPGTQAVDTVGAGDCFCGVLAVALAEGRPLDEAVSYAACAAALSVQAPGAQPSLPERAQIDALLEDFARRSHHG